MADLPSTDDLAKLVVFGYPMVYDLDEVEGFVSGTSHLGMSAPFNQFASARALLGPEVEFVSPNNDTLYTVAQCDVRGGDLLLDVPDTGDRYYVLQFVDAWTNNFAYVGRRATGTSAGRFLLTADRTAAAPDGVTRIVAPTGVFSIIGRVQVDGDADVPTVHGLQDQFLLSPADADSLAPAGVPTPDPAVPAELLWWEKFRSRLVAFPPGPSDDAAVEACAALGLTGGPEALIEASEERRQALVAGEAAGRALVEAMLEGGGDLVNGWSSAAHMFDYNVEFLEVGTESGDEWKITDPTQRYGTRAFAARAGLWGNHGYEANYLISRVDGDGVQLNGAHRYELRLPSMPPVNAFWSLTMYDTPRYYLVDNPIDRYSIGDRTPGLEVSGDGSITILLQHESPGADLEANWLPAPEGDFRPVIRLYDPAPDALDGTWVVPGIQRLD